ncbi:unnamed protein product [Lupinus luteus]|uniref:Uncharacterized protein n=1 Tax=Lupinus luteus TaxID=3873 RepID=A0AAV1WU24_LUPLU
MGFGLQIGKFYRTRNEDSSDPSIRSSKRLNPSPNSNTNPSPEIFLGNQPRTNISTSYQKNDDIVNHSSPKQISPKMGVSNGGSVSKSNIHVDGNSDHNFLSPEMRKRQLGRLHSLMVRLSAGGAKQFERFFVEEEQNKGKNVDMDMDMGLNEDEIMTCIKHETFESTKEECLENKEACSMCQGSFLCSGRGRQDVHGKMAQF